MAENSLAVPILVGIEERRFLLAEQLREINTLRFLLPATMLFFSVCG